jgi:hypothetical protein
MEMTEQEIPLTEPEERILGEFLRAAVRAAEQGPTGSSNAESMNYTAGQADGAYQAILVLRGLDPHQHRVSLTAEARVHLVRVE